MKLSFTRREIILMVCVAGFCVAIMFLKPSMEASRFINGVAKDPERAHSAYINMVTFNYFLDLYYMLLFPVIFKYLILLVKIGYRCRVFVDSTQGFEAGYLTPEEMDDFTKKFDVPNTLMEKIDAYFLTSLMIAFMGIFCGVIDGFQGLSLWLSNPYKAAYYTFFPTWLFDVFTVPGDTTSTYAANWLIPAIVLTIILEIYSFSRFLKAKKIYCSLFPSVSPEKWLNPLIILRRKKDYAKIIEDELLDRKVFNEGLSPKKEEVNMFTLQEDIDREENNFFAAEKAGKEEPDLPPNIVLEEMGEAEEDDEELIPDSVDLNRFKLKPEEKLNNKKPEETLKPCPLCGSLNPENAEECCFCGAKMDTRD